MNLTQQRNWRFLVNNTAAVTGTSGSETHANMLRSLKDMLLGVGSWLDGQGFSASAPSNPFQVVASSNGVTSGFDGVDRWTSNSSLVWNATNANRSWIVLRQTGISAKYEVLLALENTSSAKYRLTLTVSPRDGFGVANGGTDGGINSRPTATDQINLLNSADWGPGSSSTVPYRFHVSMSDDGADTRVFFTRNNVLAGLWVFATAVANDSSVWVDPGVSLALAVSTAAPGNDVLTRATMMGSQLFSARVNDVNGCGLTCTAESTGAGTIFDVETVKNQTTNKWPLGKIGLYSTSNLDIGHHGYLTDLYWVPAILFPSTIFSDQVSGFEWRKVSSFVTPWPGGVPFELNA